MKIFKDKKWQPWFIINQAKTTYDIAFSPPPNPKAQKQPLAVSRSSLAENSIKLDVDGSSLGNPGKAGFSEILCDNLGQWLSSFLGSCGFATSLNAELHVLFHGLSLAWNSGYKSVECESHSLLALQLVAEGVTTHHSYTPIINCICTFQTKKWQLSFHHVYREANICANWLSKKGSSSPEPMSTLVPCPISLSPMLLVDALRIF
ncbi:putative ribonuclease H protein [Glycine max]|nr:putative ribonuclease H protein [Glycine max]